MKTSRHAFLLAAVILFAGFIAGQTVGITGTSASPDRVVPGEKLKNHDFKITVDNFSANGEPNYVYYDFSNFDGEVLSINAVGTDTVVRDGPEWIDRNGNGRKETVRIGLLEYGGKNVTKEIELDTDTRYPEELERLEIEVEVEDSTTGQDTTKIILDSRISRDDAPEQGNETQTRETGEDTTAEEKTAAREERNILDRVIGFLRQVPARLPF